MRADNPGTHGGVTLPPGENDAPKGSSEASVHEPAPVVSLVAALNRNRVIGAGNALVWNLPRDMRHFRAVTLDKPVIMGSRTFTSIGRPLPRRLNIVLSRQPDFLAPGCVVVASVEEALKAAGTSSREIMVIGGAQVYEAFLARAQRLYLTFVDNDQDGDAHFPIYVEREWKVVSSNLYPPDSESPWAIRIEVLERGDDVC